MKKQAHKVTSRRPKSVSPDSGSQIARLGRVLNETSAPSALNSVHPIDTLLVQQLENLLDSERAFRARYTAIDSSANTPELRQAFSEELSTLRDRADRLYRLMNAMDCYAPYEAEKTAFASPA